MRRKLFGSLQPDKIFALDPLVFRMSLAHAQGLHRKVIIRTGSAVLVYAFAHQRHRQAEFGLQSRQGRQSNTLVNDRRADSAERPHVGAGRVDGHDFDCGECRFARRPTFETVALVRPAFLPCGLARGQEVDQVGAQDQRRLAVDQGQQTGLPPAANGDRG